MNAVFGAAGNSDAFLQYSKSSLDAPAWLAEQGLDWYEYQCSRGVRVREDTARQLGQNAKAAGIGLSIHAPYFISLANPEPSALEKNIGYVLASCRAAMWMGAERIVLHSGALMKRSREEALEIAKASLKAILAACDENGYEGITLCPETMGKINQLGDLDEVLELCRLDQRLLPCVDFGHLYARTLGELNGREACVQMLDKMENALGAERAGRFHSHFSKIQFTLKGGEARHLRFDDPGWGPEFEPLAEELARRDWHPVIVCESAGTQSEDALTMKQTYFKIKEEE
jgi:deoxyribonuclease-4